jgi:hypothetical protein
MDSLAEYTAPATGREFFTGPVPDPRDWDARYNAWNARHSAIKRVSAEAFVIVGQGSEPTYSTVAAKQVAIFVSYNEDLWYTKPKPSGDPDPLGFAEFAQHLNAYDHSGDLWAYYDEALHQYHYPNTDHKGRREIPTWSDWSLYPQHIGEYRVPANMVLVTRDRKELIDRQLEHSIMCQDDTCRKREFDRLARDSNPYPQRRKKSDMDAVISARTSEMGHGVAVNGRQGAANTERRRDARGADAVAQNIGRLTLEPAREPVALVPPRYDTPNGEGGSHIRITPAHVLGAAPGPSTSSLDVPPITTINPSHLSYHHKSRDVGTLSHSDLIDYLDPPSGQLSGAHQDDVPMGNDVPMAN